MKMKNELPPTRYIVNVWAKHEDRPTAEWLRLFDSYDTPAAARLAAKRASKNHKGAPTLITMTVPYE